MKDYQENLVPPMGQNPKNIYLGSAEGSPRVLFVGNSVTKHSPKPDIGWTRNCGMAASDVDHDYVHLFIREYSKKYPNASYGIMQVAVFERGFMGDFDIHEYYQEAIDWKPDIVIFFFGANVPNEYCNTEIPEVSFGSRYLELRDALDTGKTKFYHSEGFYIKGKLDEEKKTACERRGDTWMTVSDFRILPEAHGQFNHPSDLGMQMIADRFLSYVLA